ncbi:hypothetical protein M3223_02885 [Paenibacillus pasadenensis]|uniref:hypothetical protein n=1 Tax=Paenibacillus pasadenensis TaxID=217090 RepID=UPI00203C0349|nr:hypothetical protein [Paenibacillus pasadenensis]MCM3746292.1 hypothetical protein [Paenibacillus pasadenensis]
MKTYLKLVHMEIYRFRFILLGLMALTAVVQLLGMQMSLTKSLNDVYRRMSAEGISLSEYAASYSKLSFGSIHSFNENLMTFPIMTCIVVLSLYIFFIWYREWFGKSSFVYRLLMLPHPRFTLYLSKFTAIMIFVFSLVALQVVLIALQMAMYRIRIPIELREYNTLIQTIGMWKAVIFVPVRLQEFFLVYGIGTVFVLMLFTTVLLERCYRFKGLIAGLTYTVGTVILIVWIMMMAERGGYFFYPSEFLIASIVFMLFNAALSLWLGRWLLRKKVTV